jgi:hypothetical protein
MRKSSRRALSVVVRVLICWLTASGLPVSSTGEGCEHFPDATYDGEHAFTEHSRDGDEHVGRRQTRRQVACRRRGH